MGAGASADLPSEIDKPTARRIAGDRFDDVAFERAAKNGVVLREDFVSALKMNEAQAATMEALADCVRSSNPNVRSPAIAALCGIGRKGRGPQAQAAVSALIEALREGPGFGAGDVGFAIAGLREHAQEVVPALIACLEDARSYLRCAAALALGGLGAHAKTAVPPIKAMLQDAEPHVRCAAAEALGGLGEHQAEAVQALVALVQDVNLDAAFDDAFIWCRNGDSSDDDYDLQRVTVRWRAALALGGIAQPSLGSFGACATVAMPALEECVRAAQARRSGDDDAENEVFTGWPVDTPAAASLVVLSEHVPGEVPRLAEWLVLGGDICNLMCSGHLKEDAITAFGRIGTPGLAAVPALTRRLLEDRDVAELRCEGGMGVLHPKIATTLGRLSAHPEAAPALVQLLQVTMHDDGIYEFDWNHDVRDAACTAIGALGEHAAEALPALVELVQQGQQNAVEALAALGAHAVAAVPSLVTLLSPGSSALQPLNVQDALIRLGMHASAAVPALVALLKDADPGTRARAARVLVGLGSDLGSEQEKVRVADLVATLGTADAGWSAPVDAARALVGFGERAMEAGPALAAFAMANEGFGRQAACEALRSLGARASDVVANLVESASVPEADNAVGALPAESGARDSADDGEARSATELQCAAIEVLGELGEIAGSAALTIAGRLTDPDDSVRDAAFTALGKIGKDAEQCVPAIVKGLERPDDRRPAMSALTQLGPHAGGAVPALAALALWQAEDDDSDAENVVSALSAIGKGVSQAVPPLLEYLKSPEIYLHQRVVWGIGPECSVWQ